MTDHDPRARRQTERLDRLERLNARWRWICLAAIALLAVVSLRVSPLFGRADRLVAREIVLKDREGRARAELRANGPGRGPEILFRDDRGDDQLRLAADQRATQLEFRRDGAARVELRANPDGSSGLTLYDLHERPVNSLYVDQNRTGALDLVDDDGVRASIRPGPGPAPAAIAGPTAEAWTPATAGSPTPSQ